MRIATCSIDGLYRVCNGTSTTIATRNHSKSLKKIATGGGGRRCGSSRSSGRGSGRDDGRGVAAAGRAALPPQNRRCVSLAKKDQMFSKFSDVSSVFIHFLRFFGTFLWFSGVFQRRSSLYICPVVILTGLQ